SSTRLRPWHGRWGLRRWWRGRSCGAVTTPTRWWTAMRTPVILPELGAADARVSAWFAEPGDLVYEGGRLGGGLVLGATFDVPAPATGRLVERAALPEDPVVTGQVLGEIESDPFETE